MELKEIIEKENHRTEEDLHTIFFHKSGDWWRAYEWSAYLCSIFPKVGDDTKTLTSLHKIENSLDYVFVGLQLVSFDKYFPSVHKENVINIEDGILKIDASLFLKEHNLPQEYLTEFKKWKDGITVKKEKRPKGDKKTLFHEYDGKIIPHPSLMGIIQEILYYPIENKTPLDNTVFLTEIKGKFLNLLRK